MKVEEKVEIVKMKEEKKFGLDQRQKHTFQFGHLQKSLPRFVMLVDLRRIKVSLHPHTYEDMEQFKVKAEDLREAMAINS